ncbi:hypothetical protein D9H04_07950 [Escherichia coli]|nr:hypothetical protein [Escherichia coli]EEW2469484.1 hypothetical protein [Escherichia coli]EGI4643107.1 hypothetical protein [Escherichia coli]MGR07710.1 hypothetical protein [Escherichia coli]MHT44893.1 hypothetical protein [Escherichia coli]
MNKKPLQAFIVASLSFGLLSPAVAQQSANVSQKGSQEQRNQYEKSINEESAKEIQRQNGKDERTGQENRTTTSDSSRSSTESSSRQQRQATDRVSVKTAPLALMNELFAYVEQGKSSTGATAQAIQQCSIVTKPRAPQFPDREPKPVVASVGACLQFNQGKSIGQCRMELKQTIYNWATTGMPSTIRVPANLLANDGACWALYGLVAEATLEELTSGKPIPLGQGIKVGLAQAMSKQLSRADLPEQARKIAERQFGKSCVVPTSRGYRYEGKYEWSCGTFTVDPKGLTASVGELTLYGRGNSLLGQTWDLETSRSQDVLYSTSYSSLDSHEISSSDARYASVDNRKSQSNNLSLRLSERLQTEQASNIVNSTEVGFSVSQPGIKGGN